ncbi:sensor histidine kinase [Nocardiopsis sp. MG754419]|uniref:sensor histidine kinase n=1 Tax=Nocardiopsis sp. MG754419 TaxID=2259865 RepID=UPI001BA7F44A|nr:histidine kinase [Nocardiopsis sp. MG754419]MBR8743289.1 sensor histidine kinase [Nocardiopsis sp. MG754419]
MLRQLSDHARIGHAAALTRARWRGFLGIFAGIVTSLLTPAWALAAGGALLVGRARPSIRAHAHASAVRWTLWLSARDLARLSRWTGTTVRAEAAPVRHVLYLVLRLPAHLVVLYAVFSLTNVLALLVAGPLWQLATGTRTEVRLDWPGVRVHSDTALLGLTMALVVLVLLWFGVGVAAAAERGLARALLGPTGEDLLRRRIDELTRTRQGAVRAVDAERRRIERDLHDGVQQQVVALAMLLGRAQRGQDPRRTLDLVRQAHTESRALLDELREVAWRIYPNALDTLGLEAALTEVVERGPLPVTLRVDVSATLPEEVATAVYFVAREALTNAAKHAEADGVVLDLATHEDRWELVVSDDGRGGADPAGGGLTGLARRVAALDGTLTVDSPDGGPTTVRAVVPLRR